MSGEAERMLHIGQSSNLRRRLNSYRHMHPERASRRLTRLHKPRFTTLNTRPGHCAFIGLWMQEGCVQLRITPTPAAPDGELLFGAFKGLWRVRAICSALLRLLIAVSHEVWTPFELPSALLRSEPVTEVDLDVPPPQILLLHLLDGHAFGSDWAQLEAGTCGRGNLPFRDPLNRERRFIPLRLDDATIEELWTLKPDTN